MTKGTKTEALRAMREARHTEQGRPSREEKKASLTDLQRAIGKMVEVADAPPPDLKPAKPAPSVATKGKKRTAEVIGKAREAGRVGKRQLNIWIEKDLATRVKVEAAQAETTLEEWVATAIEMRLGVK
jgi:hypothetical protein